MCLFFIINTFKGFKNELIDFWFVAKIMVIIHAIL